MTTILVVGKPGSGKSEFVKKYIEGRNCLVMDVQNEYGARTKYPNQKPILLSDNTKLARSRYTGGDFNQFVEIAKTKKNTVLVFEEATIFLEGRIGKEMRKILVAKMFTGNVCLLCFHSISAIPPRILQLSDYVVLHHVNDELYQVEKKYPSLLNAYLSIKKKPMGSRVIVKL